MVMARCPAQGLCEGMGRLGASRAPLRETEAQRERLRPGDQIDRPGRDLVGVIGPVEPVHESGRALYRADFKCFLGMPCDFDQ
jgi:hypothetical protein